MQDFTKLIASRQWNIAARAGGLFAMAALVILGVSSCAPEPEVLAGGAVKGELSEGSGSSWQQPVESFDPEQKNAVLPDSFPDDFLLPTEVVVDDAGEYSPDHWFVVLAGQSVEEVDAAWNAMVERNSLVVVTESESSDAGHSSELASESFLVATLSMPGDGEKVLLSIDITRR